MRTAGAQFFPGTAAVSAALFALGDAGEDARGPRKHSLSRRLIVIFLFFAFWRLRAKSALRVAKRLQMKARLIGPVTMLDANRAGVAGAAAALAAVGALRAVEMGNTGRNIISGRRKCFDRASV